MEVKTKKGITLSYFDEGHGDETIVCVHGFLANKEYYRGLSKHFQNQCRVIAYDQRDHGFSSSADNNFSMEDLADDLHDLIEELSLENVILIGESMGGIVILAYVKKYGCQHLSKLVLGDTSPCPLNDDSWKNGFYVGENEPLTAEKALDFLRMMITSYDEFMQIWGECTYRTLSMEEISAIEWPPVTREVNQKNFLAYFFALIVADEREALEKINVPTLIIGANPGTLFPPSAAKYMNEKIKDSVYKVIGKSHLFSLECPELYLETLDEFINQG